MKLDPIQRRLYTDSGQFLKQLHCPRGVGWNDLAVGHAQTQRQCSACDRGIHATDRLTDAEVRAIIRADASACLNVGLQQDNIRVVTHVQLHTQE